MKATKTKGKYVSPKVRVLELNEDAVRTSEGTQIDWNSADWGESAGFLGGKF